MLFIVMDPLPSNTHTPSCLYAAVFRRTCAWTAKHGVLTGLEPRVSPHINAAMGSLVSFFLPHVVAPPSAICQSFSYFSLSSKFSLSFSTSSRSLSVHAPRCTRTSPPPPLLLVTSASSPPYMALRARLVGFLIMPRFLPSLSLSLSLPLSLCGLGFCTIVCSVFFCMFDERLR